MMLTQPSRSPAGRLVGRRRGTHPGGCHCLLSWVCFILLVFLQSAQSNANPHGEMRPADPLVASNTTLELNCTLTNEVQGHDAHDIVFVRGNEVMPKSLVTVLDARTALFQQPAATRNMSGSWFCYLGENRTYNVGHQVVTVADLPKKPRITECRVYNWERMTCRWEPKEQNTGIETNQTLYWTLLSKWFHCPHSVDNGCVWYYNSDEGRDILRIGSSYNVVVHAENLLGSEFSKSQDVKTTAIVEPNPVSHLREKRVGTDFVSLDWTTPKQDQDIVYKIEYRSSTRSVWQELNTTSTDHRVENLHPYTTYTFKVTCIPGDLQRTSGFWSRPVEIEVTTNASAPSAPPVTSPGAFHTTEDQGLPDKRKAAIYWQPVPEGKRNGRIEGYQVCCVERGTNNRKRCQNVEETTAELDLRKSKAYEVYIDAFTIAGFNSSLRKQFEPIIIEAEDQFPAGPTKVVSLALEDSLVSVNWTAAEGATGYTVFWCRGSIKRWTCHDGQSQWVSVDGNTTTYNISLGTQHQNYIFAVSAETSNREIVAPSGVRYERAVAGIDNGGAGNDEQGGQIVSSGMIWSQCTYTMDKEVRAPNRFKSPENQKGDSITLSWRRPECGTTAYIDKYIILYCAVSLCPETPSKVHVKRIEVDNELEDYTIPQVESGKEYNVWMQSSSPYASTSSLTGPLRVTVSEAGLSKGAIAGICIGGLVLLVIIFSGLYQTVKYCRKKVKEGVEVKFERPPELPSHISQRLKNWEYDEGDYTQNCHTVPLTEQSPSEENLANMKREDPKSRTDLAERTSDHASPTFQFAKGPLTVAPSCENAGYLGLDQLEPAQLITRVYLGNGSARMVNNGSRSPEGGLEGMSSSETVMTLLQHESSTDGPYDRINLKAGMSMHAPDESSESRLGTAPEENVASGEGKQRPSNVAATPAGAAAYRRDTSGTSHRSGSTIPEYSKCGLEEAEEEEEEEEEEEDEREGGANLPAVGAVRQQQSSPGTSSPPVVPPPTSGGISNALGTPAQNKQAPAVPLANGYTASPTDKAPGSWASESGGEVGPYSQLGPDPDYTNIPTPATSNQNSANTQQASKDQRDHSAIETGRLPVGGTSTDYQEFFTANGQPDQDGASMNNGYSSIPETGNQSQRTSGSVPPFSPTLLPTSVVAKNNNNGYVTVNM